MVQVDGSAGTSSVTLRRKAFGNPERIPAIKREEQRRSANALAEFRFLAEHHTVHHSS
jgi:hypothetical protein